MTQADFRRRLVDGPGPVVLVGAHDGLGARLIEEAGFDGVWASGFEISASHGMPDASLLTMADHVAAARMMAESTDLPVLVDADTGYGNAINAMRAVRAFEEVGAAGLCIEDAVFPKRCSFYVGVKRELAPIAEQALKIRACRDARRAQGFVVVARTEALVAGWGLAEALRRARAYADEGADAILVHSKSRSPDEVLAFARAWDRPVPLACVPTTYSGATVEELGAAGYRLIIFANQAMRASIKAVRHTLAHLRRAGCAGAVDDQIVPMADVDRLVAVDRLEGDERRYLPADAEAVRAIILAAGFDQGLMPLIAERPKAMLEVKGRTLLERQVGTLKECGIRDVNVVRGYRKHAVDLPNVQYFDNDSYDQTGELASLFAAEAALTGPVVILYGDVLFDRGVLARLLEGDGDIRIVCDRAWRDVRHHGRAGAVDLVVESPRPPRQYRYVPRETPIRVAAIGRQIDPEQATAEFAGLVMLSARGCEVLRGIRQDLERAPADRPVHESPSLARATLTDLLHEVIARGHDVLAVGTYGGWLEVDTLADYYRAWEEVE